MKIKFTLLMFFGCLALNAQNKPVNNSILNFKCFDEDSNVLTGFFSRIITAGDSTPFTLNRVSYQFKQQITCILVISKFGYFERRDTLTIESNSFYKSAFVLKENAIEQSGIILKSTRVDKNTAFAYTDITAEELKVQNLGQDITYLLSATPSSVTTSDAGAGVGYTGIRIRGSDATRINVTVNGIPINDAESHGVYWVNMPDLASSTNSVQVQRGVGSSTNGNGSFGANISVNNIENDALPGLQLQQSYGSFNTSKSTLRFSTGRLGNFSFNGRLSKIVSDGYIDRAASDLSAFQFNLNYYKKKWAVNALSFGGNEKTYQSWSGTPQSRFENNEEGLQAFIARAYPPLTNDQKENLLNTGRTYNYYTYRNQTDNYRQNHYQLHLARELSRSLVFKTSFFTTTGKGYFEEFKEGATFNSYGVKDLITPSKDTFSATDLVRQKWLDNIYYGNFTSVDYAKKKTKMTAGFGITGYRGQHFGKVIWATIAQPFGNDYTYYSATSAKDEVNGFIKLEYRLSRKLKVIEEFQIRRISYRSLGISSDLAPVRFNRNYTFFNPKAGLNYQFSKAHQVYGSFSKGNREPVRSDFTDTKDTVLPRHEQMQDIELGWINKGKAHFVQVNTYYMNYIDQLVLTGAVNDVGTPLRKNVKQSYRMGIELIGMQTVLNGKTSLEGNLTLSRNRINRFEDLYMDYDMAQVIKKEHSNTDISFSPGIIGYIGITDKHIRNFQIGFNVKYVGKQYLDNTSNNGAKINPYSTLNLHFQKEFRLKNVQSLVIKGLVNNLGSINYTNNGYTYKFISGGQLITENFYYPQAFINFLVGVDVKF